MRTPAARSLSSFWVDVSNGDQGYSHASSSGVAQYELGIGRRRSELSGSLRGREGPELLYGEAAVWVLFLRGEESLWDTLSDGIAA